MVRRWQIFKKKNTFVDFVACAERLIELGLAKKGEIAISGGSAGGLLVGAAINMRPDLFKAAVAHVPFVDVLNTMMDDSLPLTTAEYEEWGDPKNREYFEAIREYSPYDNVRPQAYPNVLATAGFNDPRVTYWEPAKWIARLREKRTDAGATLLYTHMQAGHGGASGRYEALKDVAREFAFILKIFSRAHVEPSFHRAGSAKSNHERSHRLSQAHQSPACRDRGRRLWRASRRARARQPTSDGGA